MSRVLFDAEQNISSELRKKLTIVTGELEEAKILLITAPSGEMKYCKECEGMKAEVANINAELGKVTGEIDIWKTRYNKMVTAVMESDRIEEDNKTLSKENEELEKENTYLKGEVDRYILENKVREEVDSKIKEKNIRLMAAVNFYEMGGNTKPTEKELDDIVYAYNNPGILEEVL